MRTSYNNNIRKRYASIGYSYDESADVFISPSPHPSWLLDENHDWQAPIPRPEGDDVHWDWNEELLAWVDNHTG